MRPIVVTVGPLVAAAANNIALSQTPAAAFTLNGSLASGGVATLDTYRRVKITTGGADSGKTATITGTTFGGLVVTDVLALPSSSTVDSAIDFKTVTSITVSSTLAAAATVGTSAVAGSAWVMLDGWAAAQVGLQVNVSGTVNYTVQQTFDDPNSPTNPVTPYLVNWISSADSAVVSATGSKISSFSQAPVFTRLLLNSNTNPGYATMTVEQYGPNW